MNGDSDATQLRNPRDDDEQETDDDEPVSSRRPTDSARFLDEPPPASRDDAPGEDAPASRRRPSSRPAPPAPPIGAIGRLGRACSWYEQLFKRRHKLVWSMLNRSDIPPDSRPAIHQDVFLTTLTEIEKQGPPTDESSFVARIADHKICNYLRRRKRRPKAQEGAEAVELPCARPDPERAMIVAEKRRIIQQGLARLPEAAANLIRRLDLGREDPHEVAESLGIPFETMRSQHRSARALFVTAARRLSRKNT